MQRHQLELWTEEALEMYLLHNFGGMRHVECGTDPRSVRTFFRARGASIGTSPIEARRSSWLYLPWTLTCDLISKVMLSEICVPYCFNAWNLRTSVFLLVIWTWIGVARWHTWFPLTLWPFRGQPRSSEVNDLWWRYMLFFGVLCHQRVIWRADFKFGIRYSLMCRNRVIGVIIYPKEKWHFLRFFF